MITIDEAAKKWSCSKNTVLSYVYKRYITGMCRWRDAAVTRY